MEPETTTEIELTKLNIVGEWFYHTFEDSEGNLIQEETTEEDYRQLATPEHIDPKKDGYKWKYSYSDYKYDSPSGKMEDNTYADNGEHYRVVTNGIQECALPKSEIVMNKISQVKIDSLVAEVNAFTNKIL